METANFWYIVAQEMSREKDSAIVYELVTSRYKIAERNRQAKLRFLNEMKRSGGVGEKRRDSEPSKADVDSTIVNVDGRRLDLSVPGTPVSSRYFGSLGKLRRNNHIESDSENEDNNDNNAPDKPSKFHSQLEDGLKKFTADMEQLQQRSHDPLQKYFDDSDKKKTYRRDFSEVAGEFPIKPKEPATIAKVERYFQESERMNSFKRDFADVVQTFDPRPAGDPFSDLQKPGTPISSRLIAVEKLSSVKLKPMIDFKIPEENNSCQVQVNGDDVTHDDALKVVEDDAIEIDEGDYVVVETIEIVEDVYKITYEPKQSGADVEPPATDNDDDGAHEKEKFDPPRRLTRNDSTSSNISVPGTPISSRQLLRGGVDTDDSGSEDEEGSDGKHTSDITALAKEFVHEIETLVQKSFDDDDRQEIVREELKKIIVDAPARPTGPLDGESDEKLIIHEEPQQDDSNPDGSGNRVEDYFEKSERENTYRRTFSEVENFQRTPVAVKEKVANYFRESDEKKSLTRPFSQAVNYVEPRVDFAALAKPVMPSIVHLGSLVKPGTPVSSKDMAIGQPEKVVADDPETVQGQEALAKAQKALRAAEMDNFLADDYFKKSEERNTYQRNFSEVIDELNPTPTLRNPDIEKYFEQSAAQNSFQRPFSQAIQDLAIQPRIDDILKADEKFEGKPLHHQRSSRASSISSVGSDQSESDGPRKPRKHGKKYGIDKYFATSLYRTAYHRSNSRRESRDDDNENELKILEDEHVFGETDLLRRQEFQHDDETAVTSGPNDVNENQTVQFWRDFLKPYNLNLQTEITITKDDLLNNRTLE